MGKRWAFSHRDNPPSSRKSEEELYEEASVEPADDNYSKNGQTGLHDEIRRVNPGLYMGIAHNEEWPNAPFMTAWDYEKGRTQDEVFFLFGPVNPWHGPDNPDEEPEIPASI